MKRMLSILLSIAIFLCLLPVFQAAAEDPNAVSGIRLTLPGEMFDGTGMLLPAGRVADLNPVCETEGVLAEPVRWYCGGVPMDIPDSALQPFAHYRVLVRLQAEGDALFTSDTQADILDTIQPLQGISPDGKTAYVLSPSVMTACDHSGAEQRADLSGHWMECPRCYHSFDLTAHIWDEGAEHEEEVLYTCTVCGESKTEAAGKKQLYKAEINAMPAVLRESIPEPTLENEDEFRIVRYQWYKGGTSEEHQIDVGESFEEDSYYLSITVRVKNPGKNFISTNSYISSAGAWDEVSCTVDKDAGAITSMFSVSVYPATTANITLPAVQAGEDIADSLKACKVTSPKFTPGLTSVMVYENGEFLGLYAKTALGFSTWTGDKASFQPGKVYTLVGTASFNGWYTDFFNIFVENPDICAALDMEGGAESLGFRATYLCYDEPAITTVAVSGIETPVDGAVPTTRTLRCEDDSLYYAKLTAWQEMGEGVSVFEEGHTYQAIVTVIPQRGVQGLNTDTAAVLPVIVDGRIAEFLSAEADGSFLYGVSYPCAPAPHVHSWDEGEITIQPTDREKGEIRYTCTGCGETKTEVLPELTHKHDHQPTVTEPTCEEGGYTTYTCECGDSYIAEKTEALGCDYETVVVDPTCTEDGFSTRRCRRCGITVPIMIDFVDALGHDYVEGSCTRCGAKDESFHDCPAKDFLDIPAEDHWAHPGIDYCVENELMNGTGDGKFSPEGTLTRAQLVTILYRVENEPAVELKGTFSDVPADSWYSKAVEWAEANGIVNGIGGGKFAPEAVITREQIATILYRYEAFKNGAPKVEGDLKAFPDASNVSTFATTAMVWANENEIITGASVNNVTYLKPLDSATREQIATIIMRYLEAE